MNRNITGKYKHREVCKKTATHDNTVMLLLFFFIVTFQVLTSALITFFGGDNSSEVRLPDKRHCEKIDLKW